MLTALASLRSKAGSTESRPTIVGPRPSTVSVIGLPCRPPNLQQVFPIRAVMNDKTAILVLRVSGGREQKRFHQMQTGSLAFNHSFGMAVRFALTATIPPTMAAFVSQ